jgi:hypothetical protein
VEVAVVKLQRLVRRAGRVEQKLAPARPGGLVGGAVEAVWVACVSCAINGSAFMAATTLGSREKSAFLSGSTCACGKTWLSPLSAASAKSGAGTCDQAEMRRTASDRTNREMPLKKMLMPTSVPITHVALDGHVLQIMHASTSVTSPSNSSQTAPDVPRT